MLFFLLVSTAVAYTTATGGYNASWPACRQLKDDICTGTCAAIDVAVAKQVLAAAGQTMLPNGMTTATGPLFAMFGFMVTSNMTFVPPATPGLPAIWPALNAVYECDNDMAKGDTVGWNHYAAPWANVGNCFADGMSPTGVPQGCLAAMGRIQTKAVADGVPYTSWQLLGGNSLPQLNPQLTTKQACDLFFIAMEDENAKAIAVLSSIVAVGMTGGDAIITACNKQLKDEIKKQVMMLLMIVGAVALVVGAIFASLGCCCFNRMSKKSGVANQV